MHTFKQHCMSCFKFPKGLGQRLTQKVGISETCNGKETELLQTWTCKGIWLQHEKHPRAASQECSGWNPINQGGWWGNRFWSSFMQSCSSALTA